MPHPFPDAPSIKQFVDNATQQGCEEGVVEKTGIRYLKTPDGVFATLPSGGDDELLRPGKLAQLVRALKVTGYDEFLDRHGYKPDGWPKPKDVH